MQEKTWKGMLTGMGGGLVASWAVSRFYKLARRSSAGHALAPYCIGAAAGALYGTFVLNRPVPAIAKVPLGAALYLGDPEKTAVPSGGRNATEKAGNFGLRLASKGLKKIAEKALM